MTPRPGGNTDVIVDRMVIGLIHPGEMGAALGGQLRGRGHDVLWASAGRSTASARRAAAADLEDAGSIGELVRRSDVIFSVCPPHAAAEVGAAVTREAIVGGPGPSGSGVSPGRMVSPQAGRVGAGNGGERIFVEANAISPTATREIQRIVAASGVVFVDGGIVGPPPGPRETRLYLSGQRANAVRDLFEGTVVDARLVDGGIGAASAVKMSYAAWTKGTAALVLAVRALARAGGVEEVLLDEWADSVPGLADRTRGAARSALTKGWRWVAEMEEISATFASAGLPAGFHNAAAEVFRRSPRAVSAAADEHAVSEVVTALLSHETRREGSAPP
jgi:3-hydroxyisobutyrate dehydrogenase-like beta-hydroxyacid dehydrogenase